MNTQSLKEKTWQMGSAFLMKKAENHCDDTFYLQSPFSISAYLDRLVSHYSLVPPNVHGHCYSSMSEFPVMSLVCDTNSTTKVDVEAIMYLLL